MKATSIKEAWNKVDAIFPTDYAKDERSSANAGYDVYRSTAAGVNAWISDLGDRLEVNLESGATVNVWIEEEATFTEGQLADTLSVINEAIYNIDDHISSKLQKVTGIDEARNQLYGAYAVIADILKAQHPKSRLYKQYNLKEAHEVA